MLLSLCGQRGALKRLPLLSNEYAGPTRARQGFSPSEGPPVTVTGLSWHETAVPSICQSAKEIVLETREISKQLSVCECVGDFTCPGEAEF